MNPVRNSRIRGMAMVVAIIMLALLGIALAAMSRSFAHHAKRTRDGSRDAQLRQMLLAGADSLAEKSRDWPADVAEQNWSVQLPKPLANSGASLSVTLKQPAQSAIAATVIARLDDSTARQTLTLRRTGSKWRIADARLGE